MESRNKVNIIVRPPITQKQYELQTIFGDTLDLNFTFVFSTDCKIFLLDDQIETSSGRNVDVYRSENYEEFSLQNYEEHIRIDRKYIHNLKR